MASKGVHDEVTQAEAETWVVWAYMLAGDIARIADGMSALLIGELASRDPWTWSRAALTQS